VVCSANGGSCCQHSDVVARAQPRDVPEEREEDTCRVLCENWCVGVTVVLVKPNSPAVLGPLQRV